MRMPVMHDTTPHLSSACRAAYGIAQGPAGFRMQQFLASADPSLLSDHCWHPVIPFYRPYCAALAQTLVSCQQRFGLFTLRCSRNAATACSTSLATIQQGHCGASGRESL